MNKIRCIQFACVRLCVCQSGVIVAISPNTIRHSRMNLGLFMPLVVVFVNSLRSVFSFCYNSTQMLAVALLLLLLLLFLLSHCEQFPCAWFTVVLIEWEKREEKKTTTAAATQILLHMYDELSESRERGMWTTNQIHLQFKHDICDV